MTDPKIVSSDDSPIFVVGVPRSGTTLLMALLGSHPRIACGPETHFFAYLHSNLEDLLCDPATWPELAITYLDNIRPYGESPLERYGLTHRWMRSQLVRRPPTVRSILEALVESFSARAGKPRWAEKTPSHILDLDAVRRHFPEATILKLVRDPRAVALSLRSMPWGPNTWDDALRIWSYMEKSSERPMLADSRSHVIYYEDLVINPEATLQHICAMVGETYDSGMLNQQDAARQVITTPQWWNTKPTEAIDPQRAHDWRGRLDPEEIRLANDVLTTTAMHLDRYHPESV